MIKVLVYPKDKNPYQELLYQPMRADPKKKVKIAYSYCYPFIGAILFPVDTFIYRVLGYKLIHVHWPAFRINVPGLPFQKELSYVLFKLCVVWLRLLGYKIVWTVHNLVPHEPQTSNDLKLMQYFSRIVDAKIVHSRAALEEMRVAHIDTNRSVVIPIGSYGSIYPQGISPAEARKKLKIPRDEFVILFFGQIRPYKGVEELLDVFARLNAPNTRLVIAGKCSDETIRQSINAAQEKYPIDFYDGYMPDEAVATYFHAANVVCLPFRKIMTSSSALLAMAFGKPIIAPRLGGFTDLPPDVGFIYDPETDGALGESLNKAMQAKPQQLSKMGKAALRYTETLSWDNIADRTYKLYGEVLSRPANEKS